MILQVRKYISLFFLLLLLIFQSCKQKKIDEAEKLILDVSTLEYKLQLDFDQISGKFIQLETNDESIIGRIDKVITHKNRIFILDKELSKSIYIFTAKGRYLNKIAKIGQGPGEYIALDDITLTGNEIVILDIDQEKLIYYLDNQFRKERKIDQEFYALENFQQHFVCVNNSCFDESNFYFSIDPKNIIKSDFNYKEKLGELKETDNPIIYSIPIGEMCRIIDKYKV